jgi:transposase-like protein
MPKRISKRKKKAARSARGRQITQAKVKSSELSTRSVRRRRHTPAERAQILAAAQREGLSGAAAAKRFGISTLTFYTWRKKAGGSRRRGARLQSRAGGAERGPNGLAAALRREVRAKIAAMLPGIVKSEIAGYLGSVRRGRR